MSTLAEYRSREHWSYSAINQFVNICSLQFFFDRIAKLPKAFTPLSLSFGSAYHRALEWVHLTRKEGAIPKAVEIRDLFADIWGRQLEEDRDIRFDEGEDAESCRARGMDMVAVYVEQIDPEERVVSVNEAFAVPLVDSAGNVLDKPLVGELDLVVDNNGVTISDMKTSARRWPKGQADKSLQPTAYLYAYELLHGVEVPFRFEVVVKNKTPVVEHHVTERTTDQFHRMVELVKVAESMIAAEHFLPSEQGFYCAGCPHQTACGAWHRERATTSVSMAA
ncbi:MAG: PD-(D/E)XK nuclease family protein [Chloroflexi bacterium]|nr:PD-(D/E)XK nuclease family protein [Chloroflexota bacterium]